MSKLSPAKCLEWKKRICCQRESGLSIERWCRENKIAPHLFHYWKVRLFPSVIQKAAFIEVQDQNSTGVTIEYLGFRLLVDRNFDPLTVKRRIGILMAFLNPHQKPYLNLLRQKTKKEKSPFPGKGLWRFSP